MKSGFKSIGVVAIFLALLIPQASFGQTNIKVGNFHEGGIVVSVDDSGQSGLICQTKDLGAMDWNEAVAACDRLGNGWRLPTKEELNLLYINLHKKGQGNFEDEYYWSSTDESNERDVWDQNFDGGEPNFGGKVGYNEYVRAVKAFSLLDQNDNENNLDDTWPPKVGDYNSYFGGTLVFIDKTGEYGLVCSKNLGKLNYYDAFKKCKEGGWRLPNLYELFLIYTNLYKNNIDGFVGVGYWSSEEYDSENGLIYNFQYNSIGGSYSKSKNKFNVIGVRFVYP